MPPQLLVSSTEQFTFAPPPRPVEVTAGDTTGPDAGAAQTREQDARSPRQTPKGPGLRQMGVGMGRRVTSSRPWLLARPELCTRAQQEAAPGRASHLQIDLPNLRPAWGSRALPRQPEAAC